MLKLKFEVPYDSSDKKRGYYLFTSKGYVYDHDSESRKLNGYWETYKSFKIKEKD